MRIVGVIGLGHMGRHVVTNLLANGYEVIVQSRSRPPVNRAVRQGAVEGSSPAELGARCDLVLTLLPTDDEVREVILGGDGVLAGARPGMVVADMSTGSPETARTIANAGREREVRVLDAPVSGGPEGARDATMAIMAGGDHDVFAAARPVLQVLGGTVVRVGPAGAGQLTKAANQIVVAGILQSVSEAIGLLDAEGVDTEAALEAIGSGLGANRILATKGAAMRQRRFEPGGRAELHHKDLGIALAAAARSRAFVPVTALVHQLFGALLSTGRGAVDHSGLLLLLDELSGTRNPGS